MWVWQEKSERIGTDQRLFALKPVICHMTFPAAKVNHCIVVLEKTSTFFQYHDVFAISFWSTFK
jgi:hypothetical protein